MNGRYLFTSESVTEGHPDKVCDQISDAVLDAVLKDDPKGRVACETFISTGLVIIGGEITTKTYVDISSLVKNVILNIGYNHAKFGFNGSACAILNGINTQSPDIAQGVDAGGAGDQGMMFGYACRETEELMPLPIMLAHKLARRLAEVRKKNILDYLGPDGKSQVTVDYDGDRPLRVSSVVIATQHTEDVLDGTGKRITQKTRNEIIETIVKPVTKGWIDKDTDFFINQTGKFVIGGPQSDTGVTGRKIIVDTYGGSAPHGGGAFSGKDPTKVDRSASYMARYIAKNLVAAGVAERVGVQLSYVIGRADPTSVMVNASGNAKVPNEKLVKLIRKIFDLTPRGIIKSLDLQRPIYGNTAAYGHFGRKEKNFTWEKTDKVAAIKKSL